MEKFRVQLIPVVSIIWCLLVIADQLLGNIFGLSFIFEAWASMTIVTSGLFIVLFSTRLISNHEINKKLFIGLAILSLADFILGIVFEDRTYISSTATSSLFLILCIHGYYFEQRKKLYLRFGLKLIVYLTSNIVLIFYFLDPTNLYSLPGFESVSWNTATGFLLYSSTLLSGYYDELIERKQMPEDFSMLDKNFVDTWFTTSFFFPVLIIIAISMLHFFGVLSTKSGMALGLFFVCLIPFPLTYLIYLQTVKWSVKMYQKNEKLFHREQDLKFHNELLQEFAQITSHNLRGPIVGLKHLTEFMMADDLLTDKNDIDRAKEISAIKDYIVKPIDQSKLSLIIDELKAA